MDKQGSKGYHTINFMNQAYSFFKKKNMNTINCVYKRGAMDMAHSQMINKGYSDNFFDLKLLNIIFKRFKHGEGLGITM